jgi:hypothetical protein
MIEVLAEVFIGLAVAGLATVQWFILRRDGQRQHTLAREAEEAQRRVDELERVRQRDANVAAWGGAVIDLMAELEVACWPLSSEPLHRRIKFHELGHKASALVDRGRLFFPNVKQDPSNATDEGVRVRILDQVLRACYVARHLAAEGGGDPRHMRHHVWQARRDFVALLQGEIKLSLRPVTEESVGDSVPIDPQLWSKPTKPLRLPEPEPG